MSRYTRGGRQMSDLTRADLEQIEERHEARRLAEELEEHYDGGDDDA
jgi:hypothetical protein